MALLRNKQIYKINLGIYNSCKVPYTLLSPLSIIMEANQLIVRKLHLKYEASLNTLHIPEKTLKRNCHAAITKALPNNEDDLKPQKSIRNGPGLDHFIANLKIQKGNRFNLSKRELKKISHPYVSINDVNGHGKKVFFKVYGCQMNVNDADIAWSILKDNGYNRAESMEEASIILIITCAIREGAEDKIWRQLSYLRSFKNKNKSLKIGVLGCMAERIGTEIIEKENIVDVVAGPDSYKDLPRLLAIVSEGEKSVNILLSHDETYASVNPVSLSNNKVSAFVSIMRGCDNMCSFCIVPFTRGRERSRDMKSIVDEVRYLSDQGIKEVTLLGQNVNSYRDTTESYYMEDSDKITTQLAKGFKTVYKPKCGGKRFADLLDMVSQINPEMRIRFTSPHPKDFPDEVLYMIKEKPNICNNLHLPAQCGSTRILDLMNRGYTREAYLELVSRIKSIIPSVALSSDLICGFCNETEEEFQETISLLEKVHFNFCYIFPYSMREKTSAHRNLTDDVPHHVKIDRLRRLNVTFRNIANNINIAKIGKRQLILVANTSRRSERELVGRNDENIPVIIPDVEIPCSNDILVRNPQPGDYVEVVITNASSQCFKAVPVRFSSIKEFVA